MAQRDSKYILRRIFGHENLLRYRVTVGCNGMLITGLVSKFENYVSTLSHIDSQSGEPNRVMSSIEFFSDLDNLQELRSNDELFFPMGISSEDCDDLVVLQEVTIQLPNGLLSPMLSFWFGKLSSIDFWMDAPRDRDTPERMAGIFEKTGAQGMTFKPGDRVVHKSDRKPRAMVVVAQAVKAQPPLDIYNELANAGRVPDGSYYCTWMSGDDKKEGYFSEVELELQP